jgi:uncharacterized protein (DUF58 family)
MRFRLTRDGRFFLALAVLLWAIGWGKGVNLLVLLAYLMVLLFGLNAVLAYRGLRRLDARRLVDGPIFAGQRFVVTIEAINESKRALLAIRLTDSGPQHAIAWSVPHVDTGATLRRNFDVILPRRGLYHWGALEASSGVPFGFVAWTFRLLAREDVVVAPPLGRLHRGRLRRFLKYDNPRAEAVRTAAFPTLMARSEFHGLRPMRDGDSPRWIHWRTSARRGELMVREFEMVVSEDLVLVVAPPPGPRREPFLSLAATICWEWCRQRSGRIVLAVAGPGPVVLKGDNGPEFARHMLELLAMLLGSSDPAPLLALLERASLPSGAVLVLGPHRAALADPLARLLHRPVACLDGDDLDRCDFFESAADDEP